MLFARAPEPGRSKTRLASALGAEGASRLYEALLADTLDRLRAAGVPLEIHAAGAGDAREWFRDRYPDLPVRRQEGQGLGDRLEAGFQRAFRSGVTRAVAVGSDHPTLPGEYLARALRSLEDHDAVVGPGRDGGYYAVGVRRESWPAAGALFRGIPWSTEDVLAATRNAAREAGLNLGELPEWYDVDRPGDLDLLRRDASPGSRSLRTLRALREREGAAGDGTTGDRGES